MLPFLSKLDSSALLAITFNLNDTFYYACADGCSIYVHDLEDLEEVFSRHGFDTVIAYEAIRRGHDPKIPQVVTESYKLAKQTIRDKDAQLKVAIEALQSIQLFIHDGFDMKQIATEALKQIGAGE